MLKKISLLLTLILGTISTIFSSQPATTEQLVSQKTITDFWSNVTNKHTLQMPDTQEIITFLQNRIKNSTATQQEIIDTEKQILEQNSENLDLLTHLDSNSSVRFVLFFPKLVATFNQKKSPDELFKASAQVAKALLNSLPSQE